MAPIPVAATPLDPSTVPPPIPREDPAELFDLHSDEALGIDPMEEIAAVPRFSGTKSVDAVPISLDDDSIRLMVSGNRKAKLEYSKIEALGAAVVSGIGPQPILLIDLMLNWTAMDDSQLRTIRLRNTQFDPMALVPNAPDAMQALKDFLRLLIERSECVALPSMENALGEPFEVFDDLAAYERKVLTVES